MPADVARLIQDIDAINPYSRFGRVTAVSGLMVEVGGLQRELSVGGRCIVETRDLRPIPCEVVGFRQGRALLMPFGNLDGVGLGCRALVSDGQPMVYPTVEWLGRVVNALGEPVDGKGPLPRGEYGVPIRGNPPPAHARRKVRGKMDLGIRAVNTFLTCCFGQRMGIFAGSGVGKSSVMSMLAKFSAAQIAVIGLIGERGRELQEFISEDLGEAGMARSVVVCATSDEAPLMRRQAAYMTLAISEAFRDMGGEVLCMMDSVTRFAMAQREIGLSAGEPPTTKGYPPTVFAELPRLLERAGPGVEGVGNITGLFTVLVEGDDHNEPISDAVRGILDGHIVLERQIGERGRYPAINILRSVSRTMPGCNNQAENELIGIARRLMATYDNMAEMIRLGAYKRGSDPEIDQAIHFHQPLEEFLKQRKSEPATLDEGYAQLAAIFGFPWPPPGFDEQPAGH